MCRTLICLGQLKAVQILPQAWRTLVTSSPASGIKASQHITTWPLMSFVWCCKGCPQKPVISSSFFFLRYRHRNLSLHGYLLMSFYWVSFNWHSAENTSYQKHPGCIPVQLCFWSASSSALWRLSSGQCPLSTRCLKPGRPDNTPHIPLLLPQVQASYHRHRLSAVAKCLYPSV